MPNMVVSKDPHSWPTTPPMLVMDMSRAYRVPSTPTGQMRAPITTIGIVMNCPTSVITNLSTDANTKSGMPMARLVWKTNSNNELDSTKDRNNDAPMIL